MHGTDLITTSNVFIQVYARAYTNVFYDLFIDDTSVLCGILESNTEFWSTTPLLFVPKNTKIHVAFSMEIYEGGIYSWNTK